ncbi:hypothetical protein BGZ82_002278 [Podila clonocystis]|nr:hypothetical protein BGZ82_002278 [Podila clonocystis]
MTAPSSPETDPDGLTQNFMQDEQSLGQAHAAALPSPPAASSTLQLSPQQVEARAMIFEWFSRAQGVAIAWYNQATNMSLPEPDRLIATQKFLELNAEARRYHDALNVFDSAREISDILRRSYHQ